MMLKLSLAAIIATALPAEGDDYSERIAGGTPAALGNFPFIVSIMTGGQHTCGGSLVGPDTVLTAAHCISRSHPINSLKVRAGSLDSQTGGTVVGLRSMTAHRLYNQQNLYNDIAIFKLSQPISESSSIKYAKLSGGDPPSQAAASITGWGAQRQGTAGEDVFPSGLQTARATIMDRNSCRNQGVPGVTENTICVVASAGPGLESRGPGASRAQGLFDFDWTGGNGGPGAPPSRGLCSGDSGGPIVVNGEVVGVVSFVLSEQPPGGIACQSSNQPAVATRVDKYLDTFIKPALQDDKTPQPPQDDKTPQPPQDEKPQDPQEPQRPPGQGPQSCPPGCISLDDLFNQPPNVDWSGVYQAA